MNQTADKIGSAWRQRDFDFVTSEQFSKLIEREGIKLINLLSWSPRPCWKTSPENLDIIEREGGVRRQNAELLNPCLGDEKPVKGILMMQRQ